MVYRTSPFRHLTPKISSSNSYFSPLLNYLCTSACANPSVWLQSQSVVCAKWGFCMWWCWVKFVTCLSHLHLNWMCWGPSLQASSGNPLHCETGAPQGREAGDLFQEKESWTAEKGTGAELLWTNHSSWETTEELSPTMQTALKHWGLCCWES